MGLETRNIYKVAIKEENTVRRGSHACGVEQTQRMKHVFMKIWSVTSGKGKELVHKEVIGKCGSKCCIAQVTVHWGKENI